MPEAVHGTNELGDHFGSIALNAGDHGT